MNDLPMDYDSIFLRAERGDSTAEDTKWCLEQIRLLRIALRPFAEMARPNEDETKQGHGETIVARGYVSDMTVITSGDVAVAGRTMWPKHGCDPDVWYPEDGS